MTTQAEIDEALERMRPCVMTDEQIDAVFNAMPGGVDGWLKEWGYRQFARALLKAAYHDR